MRKLGFIPFALALTAVSFCGCVEQPTEPILTAGESLFSSLGPGPPLSPHFGIDCWCDSEPEECIRVTSAKCYSGPLSLLGSHRTGVLEYWIYSPSIFAEKNGAVRVYACTSRSGAGVAADECINHRARWRLILYDDGTSYPENEFYRFTADEGPLGFKVSFLGQGSGYANATEIITLYPGFP